MPSLSSTNFLQTTASVISSATIRCCAEDPARRWIHGLAETGKTWGPVDGRGHAMFGWAMEEEAKLEFTITVNWRREAAASRRRNWGRWTAALATRPKMWVCNSRMPSQFSAGYKRLWSPNNCSGTAKLCGRVPAVIVAPFEGLSVPSFRYGVWEARCACPTF
jgi:hypothetical protein